MREHGANVERSRAEVEERPIGLVAPCQFGKCRTSPTPVDIEAEDVIQEIVDTVPVPV